MQAEPGALTHLVTATDVRFAAGAHTILDHVSFRIERGKPTAVIGPNGSGKTTLLRALMGLVPTAAGSLTIAARQRAIVFQKPIMLRRTVAENVAFARAAAGFSPDDTAVAELLGQVELSTLAERPARKLSGGEQQRLAIARALSRQPDLLLLDEATASLDPAQCKIIEHLIATIAQSGVKIVFATHDLAQARRCAGDVMLLARGQLIEHAPTITFFNKPVSDVSRRFLAGELIL